MRNKNTLAIVAVIMGGLGGMLLSPVKAQNVAAAFLLFLSGAIAGQLSTANNPAKKK